MPPLSGSSNNSPPADHTLNIWSIAGPSILVFLLTTLAGIAIIKIAATLGTESMVAVTAGQRIHFIQLALMMGMGAATTALISRAWGAENIGEAVAYKKLAVQVALAICIVISLLVTALAPAIADFFQLEEESRRLAITYIRWMFLFAPFQGIVMVMSTASRAVGDAKAPLYIGIVSNSISVFSAYALAHGKFGLPALGVSGAAIGWGVAYFVSALVYLISWYRGKLSLPFRAPRLEVDQDAAGVDLKYFTRISLPAATEQLVMQGAMIVFIGFVASYGAAAFAAYGVGINLLSIAIVIGLGFSIAASAGVGQSLGAEDVQRAWDSSIQALRLAMIALTLVGALSAIFAKSISQFMVSDPSVVELTALFLVILAVLMPLLAVELVLSGAMRGAGDTRFPLIAGLITALGIRIPLAALCTWLGLPVWCVFSVFVVDQLVKCVLLIQRFRSKRWLNIVW